MPTIVPVAHDFICPWCWVGYLQTKRLREEFDVAFDWLGYELFPEEMPWPEPSAPKSRPPDRPRTLSRFEFLLEAEGLTLPEADRPELVRTHAAHEAVEFAKSAGVADQLVERLYIAYWKEGKAIGEPAVLRDLARGLLSDLDALERAIEERRFADRIVGFDEDAYARGVYNVPTFWIGEKRYAEMPTSVLRRALAELLAPREPLPVWDHLDLPAPPPDRPTVLVNMITTVDGKIVTGERTEPVADLGSPVDYATMRALQRRAQGVLVGAGNLRATPGMWYPSELFRFVATRTGRVPTDGRFFTDAPERAFVICPESVPASGNAIAFGRDEVDWSRALAAVRHELGVQILLVEGGAELNAALLRADLVDELFLTLAPKVKLGRDVPTYAGGDPLPRGNLLSLELVDQRRVGDEVFLRYRRRRS